MKTSPSTPIPETWARALRNHRLSYPDVHVVRFLASAQREQAGEERRALDVGFGSGHHLRALAEFGYETWGTELLAEEVARQRAELEPFLRGGRLLDGQLDDMPELRGRFDVVVAWGVVFLQRPSEMTQWLQTLRSVLRPGGRACMNFRAPESWFCGLGAELEPCCYRLDDRAGPYAGATVSFFDEQAVRSMMVSAGWKIDNFEREDWCKNNLSERHSWWIVWARS